MLMLSGSVAQSTKGALAKEHTMMIRKSISKLQYSEHR